MGDILVFAEHVHGKFRKTTRVGFAAGKDAAAKFGGSCHAVVAGAAGLDGLAAEAASYGMKTVYQLEHARLEHYVADAYSMALAALVKAKGIDTVVATATAIGK